MPKRIQLCPLARRQGAAIAACLYGKIGYQTIHIRLTTASHRKTRNRKHFKEKECGRVWAKIGPDGH
jgi:hypothetical protein